MGMYILNKVFMDQNYLKKITDFKYLVDIYELLNFSNKENIPPSKKQQKRNIIIKDFQQIKNIQVGFKFVKHSNRGQKTEP